MHECCKSIVLLTIQSRHILHVSPPTRRIRALHVSLFSPGNIIVRPFHLS